MIGAVQFTGVIGYVQLPKPHMRLVGRLCDMIDLWVIVIDI